MTKFCNFICQHVRCLLYHPEKLIPKLFSILNSCNFLLMSSLLKILSSALLTVVRAGVNICETIRLASARPLTIKSYIDAVVKKGWFNNDGPRKITECTRYISQNVIFLTWFCRHHVPRLSYPPASVAYHL